MEGDNRIAASIQHLRDEDRDLRRGDVALVGGLAAVAPAVRDGLFRARHPATERPDAPSHAPGKAPCTGACPG